ncbi:transglycosylase domain-containing protein [Bacillus andreraoultii]|uniref:transglycosylase domain-containing protein n=1 Tax=Bacillus andreraoultii TaxID=1499685 RepID=UPI00053A3073|nr:PBP1A family penicillin-binding protein [Bacillus andreraoultii]
MTEQYKSRTEKRRASQQKKAPKQKQPKTKGIVKKILLTLLVIGFIGLVSGVGTFAYFVSDAPKLDPKKLKVPVSSKVYDMDRQLVTELGTEKRDLVEFDEVPDLVKNAVLATEDVRFFKHHGIDLIRLGGAVMSNVKNGFGSQGASTLTQQVVKMSFLSSEKTIKRKAQEAWLSLQLERNFSKEDIFEMYVNRVNMGGNIYGIKTAAKTYFNKGLDELTLPEVALIAGLPQRPNAYNPFVNPDLADKRKNTVLSLMHQHGFISEQDMKKAQNTKISTLIVNKEGDSIKDDSPFDAFVDQIVDEVEALGYNAYTDGLEIYTTLDQGAQSRVNDILNTEEYIDYPNDEIQAGVVLLDTKTGEIRAIGGGRHQKVRRAYNYAIDISRPPGSTIKPVLDYGPAIEYLKWSTYQIFEDKPYTYSDGTPVRNWSKRNYGNVTMRYALQQSLNIPAVQAIQAVGVDRAREFATGLGIPLEDEITEAYGIGGFKHGIAPIHLAGAFSAFGNEGMYNEPHAIRKIVLSDRDTELDLKPKPKKAMNDYTAFMISDMLKTVVQSGTGARAQVPGVQIAGKTGTTNYTAKEKKDYNIADGSPDAWFAGYSTNYTAAVWVGYEKKKNPVDDTKLPQKIFKSLMTYMHDDIDTPDFTQPSSVVKLPIEKGSNPAKLASEYTPKSEVVYEYFVKGHEPKETSVKYEKTKGVSNLNVKYNKDKATATLNWDYDGNEGATFDVYVSLNGGSEQKLNATDKKSLEVQEIMPGFKYTFTVYAIINGRKSDGASVSLDLSSFVEDNPDKQDELPEATEEDSNQETSDENSGETGNKNPADNNNNKNPNNSNENKNNGNKNDSNKNNGENNNSNNNNNNNNQGNSNNGNNGHNNDESDDAQTQSGDGQEN